MRQRLQRPSVIVPAALAVAIVTIAIVLAVQNWTGPHLTPIAVAILTVQIMDGPVPVVVYGLAALAIVVLIWRRPSRKIVARIAVGVILGAARRRRPVVAFSIGPHIRRLCGQNYFVVCRRGTECLRVGRRQLLGFGVVAKNHRRVCDCSRGYVGDGRNQRVVRTGSDGRGPSRLVGANRYSSAARDRRLGCGIWEHHRRRFNCSAVDALGSARRDAVPRKNWVCLDPQYVVRFQSPASAGISAPRGPGRERPSTSHRDLHDGPAGKPGRHVLLRRFSTSSQRNTTGLPRSSSLPIRSATHPTTRFARTPRYSGNSETYITRDVVNWARTHLHVLGDPAHWTVAGYSNGGECAAYFGAKYPQIWGNVLDISGEGYAGSEEPKVTVNRYFHGNWHAYERTWPVTILSTHTYPDSWGVFTVSSDDLLFRLQATSVARSAGAAGWKSTFFEVPDGGHGGAALTGGLDEGFKVLFPRWGLSAKQG